PQYAPPLSSRPTPFVVLAQRSHFAIPVAQKRRFSAPPPRRGGGRSSVAPCPQPCCRAPLRLDRLSHLHGVEQERRVLIVKRHHVELKRFPQPHLQVGHVIDRLLPDMIGCYLLGQLSL